MKNFSNAWGVSVISSLLFTIFVFGSCRKSSVPAPTPPAETITVSAAPTSQTVFYKETGEISISATDGATISATANGNSVPIVNKIIALPNLIENTTVVITAVKSNKTATTQVKIDVVPENVTTLVKPNIFWQIKLYKIYDSTSGNFLSNSSGECYKRKFLINNKSLIDATSCPPPGNEVFNEPYEFVGSNQFKFSQPYLYTIEKLNVDTFALASYSNSITPYNPVNTRKIVQIMTRP